MTCLLLANKCTIECAASRSDVFDHDGNQVTATQLAVDSEVEEGQIALAVFKLEPGSNRPHVFGSERRLWADQPALIPRPARSCGRAYVFEIFHRVFPQLVSE